MTYMYHVAIITLVFCDKVDNFIGRAEVDTVKIILSHPNKQCCIL